MMGTDPYYHIWRARGLAESFPEFPTFDPFITFPVGAPIPWPPGFDLLLAAPGLLGAPVSALAYWGALLMPLLGGVAVYLTFRLGMRIFNPATGLVAAVFMALMGGAIDASLLGRVDHHALVAPVTLGMFLALLRSLGAGSPRRAFIWGAVCGLLAAVSVGCWIITPPLYFLAVPLTILILRWSPEAESARRAAISCLGSAAVLVLLVVLLVADLPAKPFALYQPSWLTVMFFGLSALLVIPFFFRRLAWVGIGAVLVVLGIVVVAQPEFLAVIRQGLQVASGGDPTYKMAQESSHILFEGGLFTLSWAVTKYTYLLLLVPFLLVVWLGRTLRAQDFSGTTVFGLVFVFLGVGFLLVQRRFGEFAAPALALLFGWMFTEGARVFCAFFRQAPSRSRAFLWGGLLVAALGAAVSPLATVVVSSAQGNPVAYQGQVVKFGREIREQTPEPRGPDGKLTYGVISGWNESHPLLYAAGRPVMVSSFGTREALEGNRTAFRLLLSPDEEAVYSEMVKNRIRFVVTSSYISQIVAMAEIAGISEPFVRSQIVEVKGRYLRHFVPLAPFGECIYTRLFLCDGSAKTVVDYRHKPLGHFRLSLESETSFRFAGVSLPLFKAFEVVAGARIAGKAQPGQLVKLELPLKTNTRRSFFYLSGTTAGPDGCFEIIVPYPTEQWGGQVVPVGPYSVKVGETVFRVDVTEEDVQEGRKVPL